MTENSIQPALERAVGVLTANRYFVLSTSASDGPWAAALAYTLRAPNLLYFVSSASSRHAQDIGRASSIAGVIFDSTARTEDVESIQFSGNCVEVHDHVDEIRAVLGSSARRSGGQPPEEDEVASLAKGGEKRMYRVEVQRGFVLDQLAWLERGLDAREEFDVIRAFSAADAALR